jgi:hypothetical protein
VRCLCSLDIVIVCYLRELDTVMLDLVFFHGYLEAMLINTSIPCYVGI